MKQEEVNKLAAHLQQVGLRREEIRKALFNTKGIRTAQITTACNTIKE